MFKHYFEQIHNIEIWPIISLSIFFIFFLCLILYIVTIDKKYIREVSELPLEDGTSTDVNIQEI